MLHVRAISFHLLFFCLYTHTESHSTFIYAFLFTLSWWVNVPWPVCFAITRLTTFIFNNFLSYTKNKTAVLAHKALLMTLISCINKYKWTASHHWLDRVCQCVTVVTVFCHLSTSQWHWEMVRKHFYLFILFIVQDVFLFFYLQEQYMVAQARIIDGTFIVR